MMRYMRGARFWCWLIYGHLWNKTRSRRMMSREMNTCTICGTCLPGPD